VTPAVLVFVCTAQLASAPSASVPSRGRELAAVLTYERRAVDGDGKRWSERTRERFVREGDHVWIEREGPRPTRPLVARHSVDVGRMARHFVRQPDGRAQVALVSARDRMVVDLERADLSVVDASERFEDAWTLVPRALLANLKRSDEPAPAGAEWRTRSADGVTVRVLWSTALDFPLVVERVRADGRGSERMTATLLRGAPPEPWRAITSYRHKDFSDFGD
jgi:hypothetical protein